MSIDDGGGYKTKLRDMIEKQEKETTLKTESRRGKAPQDIRRVERGDRNENIPTRPNRLCVKLETAISDRRPRPTRKKEELYK